MLFNVHENHNETPIKIGLKPSLPFFHRAILLKYMKKLLGYSTHGRFRNNIHVCLQSLFIGLTEVPKCNGRRANKL